MKKSSRENRTKSDPFRYSLNLLARRDYSCFELKERLSRNFDRKTAEETVKELVDRGLLSDERYVERVIMKYGFEKRYGFLKIQSELVRRGLSKRQFFEKLKECISDETEKQIAESLVSRKPKDKIAQYLLSRGFRPHIVREVLAKDL